MNIIAKILKKVKAKNALQWRDGYRLADTPAGMVFVPNGAQTRWEIELDKQYEIPAYLRLSSLGAE